VLDPIVHLLENNKQIPYVQRCDKIKRGVLFDQALLSKKRDQIVIAFEGEVPLSAIFSINDEFDDDEGTAQGIICSRAGEFAGRLKQDGA
jgi:hypothetical protein